MNPFARNRTVFRYWIPSVSLLALWFFASILSAEDSLVRREWMVEGIVREARVHVPETTKTNASPVVFVFHGHGGSMQQAARSFHLETLWPEAIVIYPQGLNTPGRLTDPQGRRAGWQAGPGDQGDRDLRFFDTILESLKVDYALDPKRIYATGHSNGGAFTYLLWAARGGQLAAVAPSAGIPSAEIFRQLQPKPVLHIAGKNDALVKFAWQERTLAALRRLNQCGEGQPWHDEAGCVEYASPLKAPVLTFIYSGTHTFPPEAPPLIVRFFQERS